MKAFVSTPSSFLSLHFASTISETVISAFVAQVFGEMRELNFSELNGS